MRLHRDGTAVGRNGLTASGGRYPSPWPPVDAFLARRDTASPAYRPEGIDMVERSNRIMGSSSVRQTIRSIALPVAFSGIGFLVVLVLKKPFHVELSKLEFSAIAFLTTSLSVLLLFPTVFRIPFGKVSISDFVRNVGLSTPKHAYKFVLLGILAALCTLSGMLIGSILTGKFAFSFVTITVTQAVFSLTPGIWEEVLFRGVVMIVLLRLTRSYHRALIVQVVIFGLAHIKGIDLLSLVDALSVMILAIAFTSVAYRTKSLIPGIIFHYLHDTFLFFVQLPDGEYSGFRDNALFFGSLWVTTALAVACINTLSKKYSIVGDYDFYALNSGVENKSTVINPADEASRKEKAVSGPRGSRAVPPGGAGGV